MLLTSTSRPNIWYLTVTLEVPHERQFAGLLIKNRVALLRYVMSSQISPILLHEIAFQQVWTVACICRFYLYFWFWFFYSFIPLLFLFFFKGNGTFAILYSNVLPFAKFIPFFLCPLLSQPLKTFGQIMKPWRLQFRD